MARCGALHYLAGDPHGMVRVCTREQGHPGYHEGPKAEPVHVVRSPLDRTQ